MTSAMGCEKCKYLNSSLHLHHADTEISHFWWFKFWIYWLFDARKMELLRLISPETRKEAPATPQGAVAGKINENRAQRCIAPRCHVLPHVSSGDSICLLIESLDFSGASLSSSILCSSLTRRQQVQGSDLTELVSGLSLNRKEN